ncbi:MAG: alpha/beta hydrolase-fold protein [Pyrinomonadaceae bacterium]
MKFQSRAVKLFASFIVLILFVAGLHAQTGKIIREKLHSRSLEKTVTGESADRNLSIYLPPSYETSTEKRYPVIYLLHGIGDTDETFLRPWSDKNPGFATVQEVMNSGIGAGKFGEMIVVMPDEKTNWFGSFYVNSTVTGNWEDFTVHELVEYMDGKYRTLANPKNRGIAGHSMGGYGALTLSMKHPEVFSAAYAMNPAIIDWGGDLTIESPALEFVLGAKSYDDLLKTGDLYKMGVITLAQAFSPNPQKPPFFVDLPFKKVNGRMVPDEPGFTRWREHSPIRMVVKYRDNLQKLSGIRFDSGYSDEFQFIPVNCRAFSSELTNNGIDHRFEEYNGDHRNRLWGEKGRFYNEVVPFFWTLLKN